MNHWMWILLLFVFLIIVSILRDKYNLAHSDDQVEQEHKLIQKYLLNDSPLYGYNRPKLWIHSKYEINSRQWHSFMSRNSTDLNQPYLYLTIQSIVNQCGDKFHICLIDDDSFDTLLPSWKYEPLSTLAEPVKSELRHLAFLQLIYYYGGVIVPDSFLCCQSLFPFYQSTQNKPCIGQCRNRTLLQTENIFIPSPYFIAAHKNNDTIRGWLDTCEKQIQENSHSVVSAENQSLFHPALVQQMVHDQKINVLDGEYLGIKNAQGQPIEVTDLLNDHYLDIHPQAYGIYIPADEILARKNVQWFAYMSQEEILNSNMIIAKHIMAATVVIGG